MNTIPRMQRPSLRTSAAVVAAAGLIGGVAAAALPSGIVAAAPHRPAARSVSTRLMADTTSTGPGTVCGTTGTTTGPGGSPLVQVPGPSGIGFTPVSSIGTGGDVTSQVPGCASLGTGSQATQPMSCEEAAAIAEQATQRKASQDLFDELMLNYIGNNAQTWAATLASYGDTADVPAAGSSTVNQAIQAVEAQDQNDVNSLVSALRSVLEQGPAYSASCVGAGEETPQQGENDALAYAAQDRSDLDPWLENCFDAIAQGTASLLATPPSTPSS